MGCPFYKQENTGRQKKKEFELIRKFAIFLIILTIAICLHVTLIKKNINNYLVFTTAANNLIQKQSPYGYQPPLDYFKYSPLAGLLIVPFTLMGQKAGLFLFLFVQFWLFIWGFWRWAQAAGLRLEKSGALMAAAFFSVIFDASVSIQAIQVNAGLFGLMLLAGAQYAEGKHLKSGLVISLATNLKLFPFTLGLCLLTGLKKRYWLAFWGGLLLWLALPSLIIGPKFNIEAIQEWVRLMTRDVTRKVPMLDIGNFLELHFGIAQNVRNILALIAGLSIALGTFYLFRKKRENLIYHSLIPFCGIYILLFSYLSESPTSVLATAGIFLIGAEAVKSERQAWIFWVFWVLSLILIPLFYSDLVPRAWTLWARGFHLKTVGYILVMLVNSWIFYKLFKKSRAE